jgi:hypothetical protein
VKIAPIFICTNYYLRNSVVVLQDPGGRIGYSRSAGPESYLASRSAGPESYLASRSEVKINISYQTEKSWKSTRSKIEEPRVVYEGTQRRPRLVGLTRNIGPCTGMAILVISNQCGIDSTLVDSHKTWNTLMHPHQKRGSILHPNDKEEAQAYMGSFL